MTPRLILAALTLSPTLAFAAAPMDTLNKYACAACHGVTQKIVGPGFNEIAARYRGQSDAKAVLGASIKAGGSGRWGTVAMPPQPGISDAELNTVVDWLLADAAP